MSEIEIIGNKKIEKFADMPAPPATEQAKKLAKIKAKKGRKTYPFFYSKRTNKIVKISVTEGGCFQEYVGNLKKNKLQLELQIEDWKKKKIWCGEDSIKDKIEELRKQK